MEITRCGRLVDRRLRPGARISGETRKVVHDTDDFEPVRPRCLAEARPERVVRGDAEHIRRERAVHDDRGGRAGIACIEIASGKDPRAVGLEQVHSDNEIGVWRPLS
jgi:hypothetical protein